MIYLGPPDRKYLLCCHEEVVDEISIELDVEEEEGEFNEYVVGWSTKADVELEMEVELVEAVGRWCLPRFAETRAVNVRAKSAIFLWCFSCAESAGI